MSDNLLKAVKNISAGRSIAFFGAGFSHNAERKGERLPLAKQLATHLAKAIGEDEDTDLDVIADIFQDKNMEGELYELLKEHFTPDYIPEYMSYLINAPWKRIYTTNYDEIIDTCLSEKGAVFEYYDRKSKPEDIQKDKCAIIYLNGSLKNCTRRSLFSNIHITNTQYFTTELA